MTFEDWWAKESGWGPGGSDLAEGTLAREAFEAGIERAARIVEKVLDDDAAWAGDYGLPAAVCRLPQSIRAELDAAQPEASNGEIYARTSARSLNLEAVRAVMGALAVAVETADAEDWEVARELVWRVWPDAVSRPAAHHNEFVILVGPKEIGIGIGMSAAWAAALESAAAEARRRVLERWPEAHWNTPGQCIYNGAGSTTPIGAGPTEAAAWINAFTGLGEL